MKKINFENISFYEDYIQINQSDGPLKINKRDIWTMFYAKWSYINFLTIGNEGITMGILYIATKKTTKLNEVIRIQYPYKELKKIPNIYYQKIDFYKPGEMHDIFRISKF